MARYQGLIYGHKLLLSGQKVKALDKWMDGRTHPLIATKKQHKDVNYILLRDVRTALTNDILTLCHFGAPSSHCVTHSKTVSMVNVHVAVFHQFSIIAKTSFAYCGIEHSVPSGYV